MKYAVETMPNSFKVTTHNGTIYQVTKTDKPDEVNFISLKNVHTSSITNMKQVVDNLNLCLYAIVPEKTDFRNMKFRALYDAELIQNHLVELGYSLSYELKSANLQGCTDIIFLYTDASGCIEYGMYEDHFIECTHQECVLNAVKSYTIMEVCEKVEVMGVMIDKNKVEEFVAKFQ